MGISSIDRRGTIRFGLLGLAAVGGAGLLTACSGEPDVEPDVLGPGTDGIQLVSSDASRAAGDPTVLPDVVAGLRDLTDELYTSLAVTPGNLVLSPYSVLVALGMTRAGAAGQTASEMESVLGIGGLGHRWHKGVNALTSHIEGLAGPQERQDGSTAELALAAANQLFGQVDVAWETELLDLLAKEYGAGLRVVDFINDAAQVTDAINRWVEQQTNDKITDLVPAGVLDELTRLVLVNAIHLKAPWEQPFEKELTAPGAFRLTDDVTVEVPMMRQPALRGALASGEAWRAVTLPYAGQRLAMSVVVPEAGAFDDVEREIARTGFVGALAGAAPSAVDLTLPRWTFRTDAPLSKVLQEIGMPTAFREGVADFSPMTEEDLSLYISNVLHQGFIAVDEEGTEAAAATAVVMRTESALVAEEFTVDRPFLFVIHDLDHQAPLFVGRVVDPSA